MNEPCLCNYHGKETKIGIDAFGFDECLRCGKTWFKGRPCISRLPRIKLEDGDK